MSERLLAIAGIALILAIAVAASTNRRAINLRIVASALALQVVIAALVLYVPAGRAVIDSASGVAQQVINYSTAGIDMVFGPLASDDIGFSFAIRVLPVVIFFSALMSVLYHLRVMQIIVRGLGGAIQWVIGTKPVESLNAAANVFIGQTEAPLMVKPYLRNLTEPQVFALMVSGLASIAGTVMAGYALMGVRLDYMLAASLMAAPGGLLMAKLIMPDGEEDAVGESTKLKAVDEVRHANVILAAAAGAQEGLRLAVNIGAMVIAFVALIAMLNGIVGLIGGWFGFDGLTMEQLLGWLFQPVMYLLSVPWEESQTAGALFGQKLILNEFVAFLGFMEVAADLSPRTQAIITFSLCGFANLSSIAILLGGLGILIPEKRELIGRFGLRAVLAGSLSNLMSAALAGIMLPL